jgi:wyosine [tRNA(Phe)-imidazoG37] synthetase (radical SAM superfamily)
MSTVIYPSPIYGPVHSRRLGLSLGVNLMPADGKICTFDCLYCECGFNKDRRTHSPHPTRQQVAEALEKQLIKMHNDDEHPDVLTFAGNGEPTSHPEFPGIIDDTIRLRDKWCPKAKISVLSNATSPDTTTSVSFTESGQQHPEARHCHMTISARWTVGTAVVRREGHH